LTDSLAGTNMVGFEKILIAKPSDISGGGWVLTGHKNSSAANTDGVGRGGYPGANPSCYMSAKKRKRSLRPGQSWTLGRLAGCCCLVGVLVCYRIRQ
jgi:hypothetical protein